MKKNFYLIFLLISFFIFTNCNVAKRYLKQGNYDMAVKTAAKKLIKNNEREKYIVVLEEAYPKAITSDKNRIKYLHTEGQPDRWDEIFHIYKNMKERQMLVEQTYPLYIEGRKVEFKHVDYDKKIVIAKNKAANYFYNHAKYLMSKNDKFLYRQAYDEFLKAQNYTGGFQKADEYMDTCYQLGKTNIILIAVNNTPFKLSNDFMVNLINYPVSDLNGFWHQYYTTDQLNGNYDIFVNISLSVVDVSPDKETIREYSETKKIQDGWEYKLDNEGNIMTDSLGNKIKVKKYKTIKCKIFETRQYKHAHIEGAVNYVNAHSNQIIRSVPVGAEHSFENYFSSARGNQRALSNETKSKLRNKPIPFPSDIDMIYAANETLRNAIFDVLLDNRVFIQTNY